jgi:DHA2 family multidrug resistance protein-like MFS transporter
LRSIDCPDGLPAAQRGWAIVTISLGVMLSVLDGVIVNVALPAIAQGLDVAPSASVWIVNGYQIAILAALLPLASLGDIIGYRRVYLTGLALFTLSSLFCAFAPSFAFLAAARALQGVGAAAVMSVSPALLRLIYPHAMLGRGIGFNVLVVSASAAAGPPLAAAILALAHWPVLFAVNIPVGLAALLAGRKSLPDAERSSRKFDWLGAVFVVMAVGSVFGAMTGLTYRAGLVWPVLGFAAIILTLLVAHERHRAHPLVPVDLLRLPVLSFSVCASVAAFAAQALSLVALPFHLHHVFGYSLVEIGLLMTALPVGVGSAAIVAGRLSHRYPNNLLGCAGMFLFATGLILLAFLPARAGPWSIAACAVLSGTGFGLFQSPNNRQILLAAPRERGGAAAGLLAMARLLGQTFGAATAGLLLAWYARNGTGFSLIAGAGFALLAAFLNVLRPRPA